MTSPSLSLRPVVDSATVAIAAASIALSVFSARADFAPIGHAFHRSKLTRPRSQADRQACARLIHVRSRHADHRPSFIAALPTPLSP